jgi:plasmid maintenance system killer protein
MTPAITIQESFLVSAYELPKEIARKVFKALRNFVANPMITGLHLEKLSGRASRLSSIRVDEDYRIIFTKAGPTASMLYVAKHDLAYRYAEAISGKVPAAAELAVPKPPAPTDESAESVSGTTGPTGAFGAVIGGMFNLSSLGGLHALARVKHGTVKLDSQTPPANAVSVDLEVVERMFEGKYLPLARYLAKRDQAPFQLPLSDIERIIGESLPVSARKHRAWWGNESSPFRVQAVAWMGCGWKVAEVDLTSDWVRFERR